jgi:hypothetical protein
LTAHIGEDDIDAEDFDGNSKRRYPEKLVKVKGLPATPSSPSPQSAPLLTPNSLRRNRAIAPVEDDY